ncbi:hypothetical protein QE152_g31866 [Popillia japonica]|uniref:c-Myc-binding protein n=1 Tax=Popillia japonica TaxID=7064 RepID=A0AAW1J1F3_POPJA
MASNPTFKPSEGKREEFRRYLEKTGVMDALTKVLVSLYEEPEKPNDALHYLQNKLALQAGGETIDTLKNQLAEAQEKIEMLEKENSMLKGEDKPEDDKPSAVTDEITEPLTESAEDKAVE